MKKQNLLAALLLIASMTLGSFSYAAWTDQVLPIDEQYDVVNDFGIIFPDFVKWI